MLPEWPDCKTRRGVAVWALGALSVLTWPCAQDEPASTAHRDDIPIHVRSLFFRLAIGRDGWAEWTGMAILLGGLKLEMQHLQTLCDQTS